MVNAGLSSYSTDTLCWLLHRLKFENFFSSVPLITIIGLIWGGGGREEGTHYPIWSKVIAAIKPFMFNLAPFLLLK